MLTDPVDITWGGHTIKDGSAEKGMERFTLILSVLILGLNLLSGWFLPAVNDQDALLATMALEEDLYAWARHKADEGALSQSELEHLFAEQRYSGYERSSGGKGFSGIIKTYQGGIKRDMRIWGYVVIGLALVLGLIAGFGEAKAKRNRDRAESGRNRD